MTDLTLEWLNALRGWVKEMGIVILSATPDEVSCEWEVSEKHHQGYGIVHGVAQGRARLLCVAEEHALG